MADRKITDLTALAAGSQATGDFLTIVDVSEAAAVDKNKKITVESLFKGIPGNVGIGTGSPFNTGTNYGSLDIAGTDGGEISLSDGGTAKGRLFNYATDSDLIGLAAKATAGQLVFSTGGDATTDEAMRIDSSGRLLLGTTTEGAALADNLTVADSGNSGITIRSGAANYGSLYFSDGDAGGAGEYSGFVEYNHNGDYLGFGTGSTTRLRIDSSGKVLIGDTTSSAHGDRLLQIGKTNRSATYLELRTSTTGTSGLLFSEGTAGDTSGYKGTIEYSQASDYMQFKTAATERMRIDSSGNVGIGTSSPSHGLLTLSQSASSAFNALVIQQGNTGSAATDGLHIGIDSAVDAYITHKENRALAFGTANTERMRIDSSGNVGIGTSSPGSFSSVASNLVVGNGVGDNGITIFGGSSVGDHGSIFFADGTGSSGAKKRGQIRYEQNNEVMSFHTAETERCRIDLSGRLLVGTTSGSGNAKLQVQGGTQFGDAYIDLCFGGTVQTNQTLGELRFTDAASSANVYANIACQIDGAPGSNDYPGRLIFRTTADGASSPTERLRIDSNGRLTQATDTYNFTTVDAANMSISSTGNIRRSTSSLRYKTDVETMQDIYADNILNTRPVWYRSICEDDNPSYGYWGFIAEEVAQIDPRLCFYSQTDEGEEQVDGVAYDRFVPHLLNLIKRQQTAIETLETKVAALEAG